MQAVVNEHLERHQGVFQNHTGDGFMASFGSCVDAVDCALSLQATTSALNAGLPFERRVVLRMGLHTGEPLPHPSGPAGAAVVVAARLCELAGAGQVLVSDIVRALLEPAPDVRDDARGRSAAQGLRRADAVLPGTSWRRLPPPATAARADDGSRIPFIGRAAELDRLRVAFVEAAEGTTSGLVVTGEAGAGKTRLVSEFAAEAHQQGARLLYTSGVEAVDMHTSELTRVTEWTTLWFWSPMT